MCIKLNEHLKNWLSPIKVIIIIILFPVIAFILITNFWIIFTIGILIIPIYLLIKSNKQTNFNNNNSTYFEVDIKEVFPTFKKYRHLFNEFIVLDFETTGLDPLRNRIIEVAAIKYSNGNIIDTFTTLINPGVSIPYEATKIHNITNWMVRKSPDISQVMPKLLEFIGQNVIVGYNAPFDYKFLSINAQRLGLQVNNSISDALYLAKTSVTKVKNYKLITVCERLNISTGNLHRSFNDANATLQVFLKCMEIILEKEKRKTARKSRQQYAQS